jgi:hypothetical protein
MYSEQHFPSTELQAYKAKEDLSLPRLPIHPPIKPDESGVGYLMRLDEQNEYRGSLMKRYPHKDLQSLLQPWQEGFCSALTDEIEELGPQHKVTKIRFCPCCYQGNAYLKAEWQLSYSVVCGVHKVELLDLCQGCLEVRERFSGLTAHNTCGFNFATSTARECSDELLILQQFIIGEDNPEKPIGLLETGFGTLSLKDRMHIIDAFAWVAHARRAEMDDLTAETVLYLAGWMRNMLQPIAQAFASEAGFRRFLNFLLLKGTSKCSFDREYFQQFYNQLYNRMQHSCFNKFKVILEAYINESWHKTLTRRNKHFSPDTIFAHPWLSLTDACRMFDLSRSSILFAIKTNMIGFMIARHESRITYTVYRPDLLSRREEIAERVTAVEAAVILGVTKKQFLKFIKLGLFKKALPPQKGICSHWSFSRKELEQFISEVCNCPETTSLDGKISLSKAMRMYWRHFDSGIAEVVSLIKHNLLAVKRCDTQTGLRQLVVDQDNLCELLLDMPSRDVMTVPLLAQELRINEEFTYQLVNLGLIECQTDQSVHARVIAYQQLADFKEHYVLLSKLSKCLGLNSRDLINYFAAKGVYPVDHDRPQRLRQKVYVRSKIQHFGLVFRCIPEGRDWLV